MRIFFALKLFHSVGPRTRMHLRAYTAIIGGTRLVEGRGRKRRAARWMRERGKGQRGSGEVGEEAKSQKTEGKTEGQREHERRGAARRKEGERKGERESRNGEGCAAARERMDSASRDVLLTVMSLSSPKVPRRHCINLLLPTPPY